MDRFEFDRIMQEYINNTIEDYIMGEPDMGMLITYPTNTGIRSFTITNVVYSKKFLGCICRL